MSVIARKKKLFVQTRVQFWMVAEMDLYKFAYPTSLHFCMWVSLKSEVYRRNVDTRDELLLLNLCAAAASLRKSEDQLRLTKRELRKRVTKCIEVDGGVSQHLL